MRNLKRVLSLALATVMLLGMMVVGAGAADSKTETTTAKPAITYDKLTDQADIVNKEAVSLMVDLGIIVGKPDGSFAPKEIVDRATMAKLITYIMMGDVDAGLFEGTATDLKDIDKSWAKGYIKYCYANNIIAGDGEGNFMPTNSVTVAEASKMLLVAIGYDAKAQGYEGNSWSINVMRDAKIAGLLAGISAKTNDGLTRDSGAKMILNALCTPTVKYETQYDGGVAHKVNPTTKTNGTDNATLGGLQYSLAKVDGAKNVLTLNAANGGADMVGKSTIGGDKLSIATRIEDIGKVMVYYTFQKDGKKVTSSYAAAKSDSKVVAVPTGTLVTAATTDKKLVSTWLSDNGLAELATEATALYSNYGANGTIVNKALAAKLAATTPKETAYVIDNGNDGVIDALVINTLVTKTVTGDVKTATSGTKTTVTVPGVVAGYVDTANVYGYEGLAKDDVVLTMSITGSSNPVTYITKAASVTGKITGSSATKVMLDGTAYEVSPLAVAAFDTVGEFVTLAGTNYTNTVQVWLDGNGKLVYGKISSGEMATTSAILLEVAKTSTNFQGDTYQAKLLKLDGTTEIVDLAKIYDAAHGTADQSSAYAGSRGGANAFGYGTDGDKLKNIDFVKYSVDENGKYTLNVIKAGTEGKTAYGIDATTLNGEAASGNDAKDTIVANKANYSNSFIGNANTTFVSAVTDATTKKVTGFTVKTGIANAPAGTQVSGVVLTADGISSIVFIGSGTATSAGDGTFLYVSGKQYGAKILNSDKTTSMKAFVDGVEQDVVVKSSVMATISGAGLYEVKLDGTTVTGASNTATIAAGTGLSQAGGVITVNTAGTKGYYTYTENTKVYVVDGENVSVIAPADIALDTNDGVTVYGDSVKLIAKTVIITKQAVPAFATAVPTLKYGKTAAATAFNGDVTTSGWGPDDKLQLSVTPAANVKVTVAIDGAGADVSKTVEAKGTPDAATLDYTLAAGDLTGKITVTVTATDGVNEVAQVFTFTLTA